MTRSWCADRIFFPVTGQRPEETAQVLEGRLVSHRRSGRSKHARKLAHQRTDQESDYSEFGPQHRARAASKKSSAIVPGAQQVVLVGNGHGISLRSDYRRRCGSRACKQLSTSVNARLAALPPDSRISHCVETFSSRETACSLPTANCGAWPSTDASRRRLTPCIGGKPT